MEGGAHTMIWTKVLVCLEQDFIGEKVQTCTWTIASCTCLCSRQKRVEWIRQEKLGKLFRDFTLSNDETCSDGSVAMHGITTTELQTKDVEHDDDLYEL